jgi:hypothetical protein
VDCTRYAVLTDGRFDLRSVECDAGTVPADSRALNNPFVGDWEGISASDGSRSVVSDGGGRDR